MRRPFHPIIRNPSPAFTLRRRKSPSRFGKHNPKRSHLLCIPDRVGSPISASLVRLGCPDDGLPTANEAFAALAAQSSGASAQENSEDHRCGRAESTTSAQSMDHSTYPLEWLFGTKRKYFQVACKWRLRISEYGVNRSVSASAEASRTQRDNATSRNAKKLKNP